MAYNLQRIESLLLQHFNRKCLGWCEHETHMQCNNHRSTYRYSCIHKFTWKKNVNLSNQPLKWCAYRQHHRCRGSVLQLKSGNRLKNHQPLVFIMAIKWQEFITISLYFNMLYFMQYILLKFYILSNGTAFFMMIYTVYNVWKRFIIIWNYV